MSRVAKQPVILPVGVNVSLDKQTLDVKTSKGAAQLRVHDAVTVRQSDQALHFEPRPGIPQSDALAGTMRALANNIVVGLTQGFQRKLDLVGVGYRAQIQGKVLNLTLGYSHPINFPVPEGIAVETPSQTEIIVKGTDKQQVGEVAAKIRAYRPPEPYKGKGVKYSDEVIARKEAKKK